MPLAYRDEKSAMENQNNIVNIERVERVLIEFGLQRGCFSRSPTTGLWLTAFRKLMLTKRRFVYISLPYPLSTQKPLRSCYCRLRWTRAFYCLSARHSEVAPLQRERPTRRSLPPGIVGHALLNAQVQSYAAHSIGVPDPERNCSKNRAAPCTPARCGFCMLSLPISRCEAIHSRGVRHI